MAAIVVVLVVVVLVNHLVLCLTYLFNLLYGVVV